MQDKPVPQVDRDSLNTYLNDHLAGSVAALDLMDRISEFHAGSDLGTLVSTLRSEVEEEQRLLRTIIDSVGGSQGTVAQAVAWIGDKVARIKVGPGKDDDSGLMLFEALEALTLGFTGRRALWRTLAHLKRESGLHSDLDFEERARRVEGRIDELEQARLDAAIRALTVPTNGELTDASR